MRRGTTPTLRFKLPISCDRIDVADIAFAQKETIRSKESTLVFSKVKDDCEMDGNILSLTLKEEDTLKLSDDVPVEIQLRLKCGETSMATKIFEIPVKRILKDGCL